MHRAVVSKEIPGAREDVRGLDPGHRRSFMTVFVGFNRKTLDQDLTAGEVGKSGKRISMYRQLRAIVLNARYPIYNWIAHQAMGHWPGAA